jgi:hypothetical protein
LVVGFAAACFFAAGWVEGWSVGGGHFGLGWRGVCVGCCGVSVVIDRAKEVKVSKVSRARRWC